MLAALLVGCTDGKVPDPIPGEIPVGITMYTLPMGNMSISLIVDRVILADDNSAEVVCTWKTTYYSGVNTVITKYSDAANTNMYIVDNLGHRYDHTDTSGAARDGCSLYYVDSRSGSFFFPPINPAATAITFHDDDQGRTMTISLIP